MKWLSAIGITALSIGIALSLFSPAQAWDSGYRTFGSNNCGGTFGRPCGMTIYRTIPGTNIKDWSQPGLHIEHDHYGGTRGYQTIPGTRIRDWSKPGFRVEAD